MKYEKFEKWMVGKKVTHSVTLSSGVIVDIPYEGESDSPAIRVKYDEGILAGKTSWASLRNLEFLEGKPSDLVSAQEDGQVNWEVGQVVWDTAFGDGEVVSVEEDYTEYPVKVRFKNYSVEDYTKEGGYFTDCKRSLFFSEPVVTAELFPPKKKFKPVLEPGQLVVKMDNFTGKVGLVRVIEENEVSVRCLHHGCVQDVNKKMFGFYCVGEEVKFES